MPDYDTSVTTILLVSFILLLIFAIVYYRGRMLYRDWKDFLCRAKMYGQDHAVVVNIPVSGSNGIYPAGNENGLVSKLIIYLYLIQIHTFVFVW